METRCLFGWVCLRACSDFFFFNDTATTEIYTLSLHDALPIYASAAGADVFGRCFLKWSRVLGTGQPYRDGHRSEEHTSELQSQSNLVCRLLLEKKNQSGNPIPFLTSADNVDLSIDLAARTRSR